MPYFDEPKRPRTSKEEKEYLFTKQKGKCMYCGNKYPIQIFHVDHKTPRDCDGKNTITNKQLLCGSCNTRKRGLTDGKFRKTYGLPGSRTAKTPPSKPIPYEYFEKISIEMAAKKLAKRKRENGY